MLSRFSMWVLNKFGWMVHADYPGVEKYVLIAAPHTSNWDFPVGILAARAMKLDVRWMGKHTLFHWPCGWFFRALGGIPVYREQDKHLSQQMADLFARSERLILALAPEGTRSKKNHWKTGFYYKTQAADEPLVLGDLDNGPKQLCSARAYYPCDDIEADFSLIRQFYKDRRGKIPEKESLIRPG